jgi:hypothetical protein
MRWAGNWREIYTEFSEENLKERRLAVERRIILKCEI